MEIHIDRLVINYVEPCPSGLEREMLESLHRKVDCLMADLSQLNANVDALQAAGAAVAGELAALRDEIDQLQAGEITQEQIDALAGRVTDVTTKLTEGVNAPDGGIGGTGKDAPPVEEPPVEGEPPAAPPVEGEPPVEAEQPGEAAPGEPGAATPPGEDESA